MKELSIEQKAKAYDEAIERVKNIMTGKCETTFMFTKGLFEHIFPELKESEDEKMIKSLSRLIKAFYDVNFPTPEGFERKDLLAWIEKKGEHTSVTDLKTWKYIADYVVTKWCGIGQYLDSPRLTTIAEELQRKYYLEQKQGEQKSTDKVEPKFKVGDWVMLDRPVLITKVEDMPYNFHEYWTSDGTWFGDATKAKLWTIQDAKEGDVLCYRDSQWIFIYKEKIDDTSFNYYILYSTIHRDLTINDAGFTLLSDAIIPATKEQRDLLFSKMKEAGYEWDADKKELKKIKQKPVNSDCTDCKLYKSFGQCYEHGNNLIENCKDYRKE